MDLFWKLWQTVKKELENKIPDTKELVKKLDCNAKIAEIENKIRSISALATNAALTTVEDKIPNIRSLVKKKTDYDTKNATIEKIEKKLTSHDHDKYITTPEFNKLSAEVFDTRLRQADLLTKTDFDDKFKSVNQETNSNKTKHLIQFSFEAKSILQKMVHKII